MIIIRNREMIIPKTEQYIGTPYDDASDARFFKIERLLPGQVDLAGFAFALDLQFADGTTDSVALEKDVLSDRIILKWVLTDTVLAKTGSVYAQMRASSVSGLKWSTAKAAFYVMDTISNPGAVTPSTSLTELEQLETQIEASEAIRIASESARKTAETSRQSNETARMTRETARVSAEGARASAEAFRASAESARAAAEVERATTFNEKALLSKSWAVGDTGVREGEDTNNSYYWALQSENSAQRSETARELQPVIRNDYWYIWDTETEEYVNSGVKATGGAADGAVLYNTSQSLSDSEKQTARLNMGAASSADLATTNSNVAALSGRVTTNESDIASLKNNVESITGRVGEAESDIDTLEGDMTNVKASLQYADHRNMLDNPFFQVNQRNVSTWSNGYGVDRFLASSVSVTKNSNYITLTPTGSARGEFLQRIEKGIFKTGDVITASAKLSDGTIVKGTATVPSSGYVDFGNFGTNCVFRYRTDSKYDTFEVIVGVGETINIVAIKLELGSVSTLANDVAPNYFEELLKCQRYFYTNQSRSDCNFHAYAASVMYGTYNFPTEMRTAPSILIKSARLNDSGTDVTISFFQANISKTGLGGFYSVTPALTVGKPYGILFTASADL